MYLDGKMERERLEVICKRFVAQALRKNGFELSDEGVMLVGGPSEDRETYQLLKNEAIEYPNVNNTLRNLVGVWAVKGKHRDKPEQLVELLVGEYKTLTADLVPLGRLDGGKWVSPLVLEK